MKSPRVDSIFIRLQLPVANLCSAHSPDELSAVIQMPPRPSGAMLIGSTSHGTRARDHPPLVRWTQRGLDEVLCTRPPGPTARQLTGLLALHSRTDRALARTGLH